MTGLRVVLIGGTSHAGKSSLGGSLAALLGWSCRSTDGLARHPGRPWREEPKRVPEHVAEHYLSLSPDELVDDVLRHYRDNVWPLVEPIVASHAADPAADRLVLEGSAILPELAAGVVSDKVAAVWLTAGDGAIERRIRDASLYETRAPRERKMIDRFLERALLFNERVMDAVRRLGLARLDVERAPGPHGLSRSCLSLLEARGGLAPDAGVARPSDGG